MPLLPLYIQAIWQKEIGLLDQAVKHTYKGLSMSFSKLEDMLIRTCSSRTYDTMIPPTEPVVKSRALGSQLPFSQNARPRQARKAWWAGSWSDPLSGRYPWDEESWCTQAIWPKEVLLVPRRQGRILRVNLGKRWRQQGCCYGGTWGKINNAKNSMFKIRP